MRKLRVSFNAPVTLTFVALCLCATVAGIVSGGSFSSMFLTTGRMYWLSPLSWLRCFSHVLGHAGWEHFFGNAMYLILLGPILEERYGKKVLISTILATGFFTTMAITFLFPNSGVLSASGVVFAFILLASFTQFEEGTTPLTFLLVFAVYIGREVYNGLVLNDNVSQLGHVIGGFVGSGVDFAFNIKKKPSEEDNSLVA